MRILLCLLSLVICGQVGGRSLVQPKITGNNPDGLVYILSKKSNINIHHGKNKITGVDNVAKKTASGPDKTTVSLSGGNGGLMKHDIIITPKKGRKIVINDIVNPEKSIQQRLQHGDIVVSKKGETFISNMQNTGNAKTASNATESSKVSTHTSKDINTKHGKDLRKFLFKLEKPHNKDKLNTHGVHTARNIQLDKKSSKTDTNINDIKHKPKAGVHVYGINGLIERKPTKPAGAKETTNHISKTNLAAFSFKDHSKVQTKHGKGHSKIKTSAIHHGVATSGSNRGDHKRNRGSNGSGNGGVNGGDNGGSHNGDNRGGPGGDNGWSKNGDNGGVHGGNNGGEDSQPHGASPTISQSAGQVTQNGDNGGSDNGDNGGDNGGSQNDDNGRGHGGNNGGKDSQPHGASPTISQSDAGQGTNNGDNGGFRNGDNEGDNGGFRNGDNGGDNGGFRNGDNGGDNGGFRNGDNGGDDGGFRNGDNGDNGKDARLTADNGGGGNNGVSQNGDNGDHGGDNGGEDTQSHGAGFAISTVDERHRTQKGRNNAGEGTKKGKWYSESWESSESWENDLWEGSNTNKRYEYKNRYGFSSSGSSEWHERDEFPNAHKKKELNKDESDWSSESSEYDNNGGEGKKYEISKYKVKKNDRRYDSDDSSEYYYSSESSEVSKINGKSSNSNGATPTKGRQSHDSDSYESDFSSDEGNNGKKHERGKTVKNRSDSDDSDWSSESWENGLNAKKNKVVKSKTQSSKGYYSSSESDSGNYDYYSNKNNKGGSSGVSGSSESDSWENYYSKENRRKKFHGMNADNFMDSSDFSSVSSDDEWSSEMNDVGDASKDGKNFQRKN